MSPRPVRALTHPLWVASVVLLLLNDHVWKGSGVLPSVVTGKLSDVVGLLVAPVLLAALLSLRSRRGLAISHVLTGLVFAALQLSPALAALVADGSTAIGLPFVTTPDPTDLLALPALALSWVVFEPVTRIDRPLRPAVQRIAGGVGLVACVATSPPPTGGGGFTEVFAEMVVLNDTEIERSVHIRQLRPEVQLDCERVRREGDPGWLFRDALFSPAVIWELPPNTSAPLQGDGWGGVTTPTGANVDGDCRVVLVSQEGLLPHVVTWEATGGQWFPGEMGPEAAAQLDVISLVGLAGDGDDRAAPLSDAPGTCPAPNPLDRVQWTIDEARGVLQDLIPSEDGCHELVIEDPFAGEQSGYLCVPFEQIPFAVGAEIDVSIDETGRVLRIDESGLANRMLVARLDGPLAAFGVDASPVSGPDGQCGVSVNDACGHVVEEAGLLVSADGAPELLLPGGTVELTNARTMTLLFAESRIVHAEACGEPWEAGLGLEYDIVMTKTDDTDGVQ